MGERSGTQAELEHHGLLRSHGDEQMGAGRRKVLDDGATGKELETGHTADELEGCELEALADEHAQETSVGREHRERAEPSAQDSTARWSWQMPGRAAELEPSASHGRAPESFVVRAG